LVGCARSITEGITGRLAVDENNSLDAVDILAFPFFRIHSVCILCTPLVVVGVNLGCYSSTGEKGDRYECSRDRSLNFAWIGGSYNFARVSIRFEDRRY
jgi:hypothetical protein